METNQSLPKAFCPGVLGAVCDDPRKLPAHKGKRECTVLPSTGPWPDPFRWNTVATLSVYPSTMSEAEASTHTWGDVLLGLNLQSPLPTRVSRQPLGAPCGQVHRADMPTCLVQVSTLGTALSA